MSEVVKVKQGRLRGLIQDISSNGKFLSFKGIPYAKPPIGELRFKAPEPPDSWDGIREALEHGPTSPQMDMISGQFVDGSEDCLYLNVYVPANDLKKAPLPVMVYIHGGGFFSGSGNSDLYGPEFLLSDNVIVVTLNYRLEVLGFLSLENEDIPGNAGLKDQVAALRWTKDNIHAFGGDPNNITIFGESAGAASVAYHLFSPMCSGLFNKAIAHSGGCLNDWAIALEPRQKALRVAKFLGCETNNLPELAKFLRSFPAKDLVQVTFKVMNADEKRRGVPIFLSPTIEKQFPNQEAYLTEPILNLLKDGKFMKVPMIFGYNNKEGINCMKPLFKRIDSVNKDFERFVPKEIASSVSLEKSKSYGDAIKKFYFEGKDFSKSTVDQMIDLQTDFTMSYNIYRLTKELLAKSRQPIYFFKFCCDSELNIMKNVMGYAKLSGTAHADDIFYIFKSKALHENLTAESSLMILQCVRLWTNFAKFGNPTPQLDDVIKCHWSPVSSPNRIEYLDIGKNLKMGINPDESRMRFWENIYKDAVKNSVFKSHL